LLISFKKQASMSRADPTFSLSISAIHQFDYQL
jgi:hypothetical protein